MSQIHNTHNQLPGGYTELIHTLPPQAIVDDVQHDNVLEMIDRLMATPEHTADQASYLETLVQLVEAYEAKHHAIDTSDISGLDSLKYLLDQNEMSATDLAKLLGVHVSMGSKILKGDRKLTASHLRVLSERFKVEASLFL